MRTPKRTAGDVLREESRAVSRDCWAPLRPPLSSLDDSGRDYGLLAQASRRRRRSGGIEAGVRRGPFSRARSAPKQPCAMVFRCRVPRPRMLSLRDPSSVHSRSASVFRGHRCLEPLPLSSLVGRHGGPMTILLELDSYPFILQGFPRGRKAEKDLHALFDQMAVVGRRAVGERRFARGRRARRRRLQRRGSGRRSRPVWPTPPRPTPPVSSAPSP